MIQPRHLQNCSLDDPITREQWEAHWIERCLRPSEIKKLAQRRCKPAIRDKADAARQRAQQLRKEIDPDNEHELIYPFIVDAEIEGMAWGGYAVATEGEVQRWVKTWMS